MRVRIDLETDKDAAPLPWACDLSYHSEQPADDDGAVVDIETSIAHETVEEGTTVALVVTVRNLTDDGQPMTVANIGLPASLEVPTRVLDALRDSGAFDLWEIRGRTITFYWRCLAPAATHSFPIDCVAKFPGRATGPASNAYLYYTPDTKRWSPGIELVTR
jgi:hypothetical protein